jgi:enediyne biosynthesis protein E4
VALDYDRDGAPDILVSQTAYSAVLLENGTTNRRWLTVDLSLAGAQAAGARVSVTADGITTTQVALYGGSYLAGMPMELYFGLGDAVTAEDVTVTWADASTSDLGAVAADQRIRVTPQGLVP